MSGGAAIETAGLRRTYGAFTAVEGLDLEVPRGSLFALLGPNGAGKSTTIKILTTLLAPSAGSAKVAGFDVLRSARDVRRSSGVVFQESSLDDRLTARENLMLHVSVFGVPPAVRAERVDEGLSMFGLLPVKDQLVRTFSGGMRRRLEIARALTHRPDVLILDEPTVGLDPQTRRVVWDHLLAIASTRERTVFVTTHYMDEAERCGDVAIIDHGKLITRGSPRQIVERAGAEMLVVASEDNARLVEKATALGLSARPAPTGGGVEVSGERAEAMLARLGSLGLGMSEVSIVRPRLEDAFVALTGRDIRDEPDAGAGKQAAMRTQLRARGRNV